PSGVGQSIQLIALWCNYIGLPFQWTNPCSWWDDSDDTFLEHWVKVVNDRKNGTQLPNPGDIIIFDSSLPGSGNKGHASIYIKNVGPNSWTGFDCNWGGKSAHLQSHNWSYVLGWFTQKRKSVLEGEPTPIADEAPSEPYELQAMDSKMVTLKNDALLYNLRDVDWESFQTNPQSQGKAGKEVVIQSMAKHRLGGTYYVPDITRPYGYRVIDIDDHDGSLSNRTPPEDNIGKKRDRLPKKPFWAPIKDPIEITHGIPKYASMGDAVNAINSTGTLPLGTYYPHKFLDGMISLASEPGVPIGSWVNPDDILSPEDRLKKNWRETYKPFRDQYGNVDPRYYRALGDDPIIDLEGHRRDLSISRRQAILIRGWFIGPDGVGYGRPDDCVSKGELQWY
ncbi:MAG: hypothetical protein ACREHG_06910, partial [Candidatus Saccharimonadales bacterium]